MKRGIISAFGLCCAVLLLNSCATQEDPTEAELHYRSFDAWMSLYAPQAEKQETGIYMEAMELSTRTDAKTPGNDNLHWVKVNYTARTLNGDVFLTRDSTIAKWEKTFESYIRYMPDYLWYMRYESNTESNYYPLLGVYDALALMKEGDKYRVYIPAPLAYANTGYTVTGAAYQGHSSVSDGMPVIVDLELVKVIEDPEVYEKQLVQDYVAKELSMALNDTVVDGVYYKSFGFMPNAGDEPEKIVSGSTFSCRYVGRFIKEDFEKTGASLSRPPFVFDTHIKDTADLYDLSRYKGKNNYETPMSVTLGNENSSVIGAWDSVIINRMHYGEYGRIVTTSALAYSSDGDFTAGATYIPPYTPLVFDIWISSRDGEGNYDFPYLIQKILDTTEDMDDVWIEGNVYGVITGDDMLTTSELGAVPRTEVRTNILISDAILATNVDNYIPIELPEGAIRDALNYPDNYGKFYGQKLKVRGDIRDYYGVKGMTNVTEYKIY